jgi:tRNA nucleotidyltransferase (CCA-adding enzyme)
LTMCTISDTVVSEILRQGHIYEVGGAVRDKILNRAIEASDRDYLVCGIPYGNLSKLLRNHGKVDLVGRSFGVIKFTQMRRSGQFTFDISLPRREYSTGVGHKDFDVSFDPSLSVEEDLTRRDFTINAMALSLKNKKLIDPLNGQLDLKKKQIKMVSPRAFIDDPLRMIRAIQLAARLEFTIEPATLEAINNNADLINSVSPERINEELNKLLLRAKQPSIGFRLMQSTGLLNEILPELEEAVGVDQPGGYHKYNVFEHILLMTDVAPMVLHIRLASLFHDITKPRAKRLVEGGATFYGHEKSGAKLAEKIMKRLRYSSEIIRKVSMLVEQHMFTTAVTDKGRRRLIRRVGQDLIFDLLDIRRADVIAQGMGGRTDDVDEFERAIRDEIDKKPPFGLKDLVLSGNDIKAEFDLPQSPIIGEVLNYLMEKVLDNPEDNNRDKLINIAQSFLVSKGKK